MMTARFADGTVCRLEAVHRDSFNPREGEVYLFEYPDGALKEGWIHFVHPPEVCCESPRVQGIYDQRTRIVALEVP
jgi:hypothetical protein